MTTPAGEPLPARLFVLTGGRVAPARAIGYLDTVTTRAHAAPAPDAQDEASRILRACQEPKAVVELSSGLGLPVTAIAILLGDLADQDKVAINPPAAVASPRRQKTAGRRPENTDRQTLERVLHGLRQLA